MKEEQKQIKSIPSAEEQQNAVNVVVESSDIQDQPPATNSRAEANVDSRVSSSHNCGVEYWKDIRKRIWQTSSTQAKRRRMPKKRSANG